MTTKKEKLVSPMRAGNHSNHQNQLTIRRLVVLNRDPTDVIQETLEINRDRGFGTVEQPTK